MSLAPSDEFWDGLRIDQTGKIRIEIVPARIGPLDEIDLVAAQPLLELLLAPDRIVHRIEMLVVDEQVDAVSFREAVDEVLFVDRNAVDEIAGDADVESAVAATCQKIDGRGFVRLRHGRM